MQLLSAAVTQTLCTLHCCCPPPQVLRQPREQLSSTLSSANSAIDDVEAEIDEGLRQHGKHLDDAQDQLPEAVSARDDLIRTADEYWTAAYQVSMQGYVGECRFAHCDLMRRKEFLPAACLHIHSFSPLPYSGVFASKKE